MLVTPTMRLRVILRYAAAPIISHTLMPDFDLMPSLITPPYAY